MGMSSSQARLLNLTSRMHQIEYKAAKLEAQKLQMANKSAHVYETYLDALESTKIQQKKLNPDGSVGFEDATYQKVLDNGYFVQFLSTGEMWGKNGRIEEGKITITQADKDNFDLAAGNRNYFIALQTGRVNAEGYNSADGVYEIYTAAQLNNMTSSNNYRLMSNINMSGATYTSKVLGASKTFDGNGYSITGLNKALFSSVSNNSKIKNLSINGNSSGSAILVNNIGSAYSNVTGVTISDVSISGDVTKSSGDNVGALTGSIYGSKITIERCTSSATVSAENSNHVGGLIGHIENTSLTEANRISVKNCSATGEVTGLTNIGGLIGVLGGGANISLCSATGNVNSTKTTDVVAAAGGFVGSTTSTNTISDCESRGRVKAETTIIGGFVGVMSNQWEQYNKITTISNCNAYGNVYGNINNKTQLIAGSHSNQCGGFVSAINGGILQNCNYFGEVQSNLTSEGGTDSCGGFGNSDMSGEQNLRTAKVINCYTASSKQFMTNPETLDECSQAATPTNNTISVTAPNITTTTPIHDTGNYGHMFDMISLGPDYYVIGVAADPTDSHQNDTTWFTNMLNAGEIFICERDKDGKYFQTSVATNTNFQEVNDDSKLRKAEAQYEADMRKIDAKDRKYDAELAALDTERNAVKSEMETLKTVARENVERTFKLFS